MSTRKEGFVFQLETANAMFVALSKIVCPECEHELQHHVGKYGCEVERGDIEGDESGPAYALPPCGCSPDDLRDDYPDLIRAIEVIQQVRSGR